MKRALYAGVSILLALSGAVASQNGTSTHLPPTRCDPDSYNPTTPLEILTNVKGVDLRPHVEAMLKIVKQNWYSLMPDEVALPPWKRGCVVIELSVLRDGRVEDMKFSEPSGDEQLDQAAWQAIIISSPRPPLPPEGAPSVRFRLRFYYNPNFGTIPPAVIQSNDALLAKSRLTSADRIPMRSQTEPPVRTDLIPMGGQTPRGVYTPTPVYTLSPGSRPLSGVVLLSLIVSKKGDAHHVRVLQGLNHEIDRTSRETIETWKFEPATRYGKRIEMPLNVKVTLNLK